jgi:hypothetical protein
MTKYQEYYSKMLDENSKAFSDFQSIHQKYTLDQNAWQADFNGEGTKIVDIIRDYENRLCANTERGMYTKFSGGLSEKFWALIRKDFPLIDNVGLIVEKQTPGKTLFNIKKISL